jgi:quercetin dioxygenase-like cupin family protein
MLQWAWTCWAPWPSASLSGGRARAESLPLRGSSAVPRETLVTDAHSCSRPARPRSDRSECFEPRGVSSRELGVVETGELREAVAEVAIEPGGSTGFHHHDTDLRGVVVQGTLTHFDGCANVDGVYHAGEELLEPGGAHHPHAAVNYGRETVILQVYRPIASSARGVSSAYYTGAGDGDAGSIRTIQRAIELGVMHIDTAEDSGPFANE